MTPLFTLLRASTGLAEADLAKLIRTAPRRYKVYTIPKRSGGEREIAQPAKEVKFLQYVLMDAILRDLPVHGAARAYRPGLSVRDNAEPHAGATPILKMDFADFFPSIRATDWINYCARQELLPDPIDREISSMILFRKKKGERVHKLSIGAPSSPMLSNILLYRFDELVDEQARKRGISYTRYADDLTFSGQRIGMLKDMISEVHTALRTMARPRLRVNENKTTFITTSTRRVVTGITLSNDGGIGVGHDRKRLLRAQVHHAINGRLSDLELAELAGYLAFVNVAEPDFLMRLRARYGDDAISSIQKHRV